MSRRVVMMGVLAVGLLAMQASETNAHLAGTVYRPTYRHISSYDCTGTFKQVSNLEQHPALFECSAVVRSFQFGCQNPQGQIVTPGIPSGPFTAVPQFAAGLITVADQSLTDKKKGRATKTLLLPDTVLEAADAACSERNRSWTAYDELVLVADVWLRTYECVDETDPSCGDRVQASESLLRCTVPPQFSLDNPPPGTPEQPVPTDYDCTVLEEAHCDRGDLCPIPPVPFP